MSLEDLVKDGIKNIPAYIPGDTAESVEKKYGIAPEDILKLASNENQFGPSPKAIEAMAKEVGRVHIYPDPFCIEIRKKIGVMNGFDDSGDNVVIAVGASGILSLLGEVFIKKGDEVIFCEPTFGAYAGAVIRNDGTPVVLPLTEDLKFDLKAMYNAITDKTKMIVICSPNNPIGGILTKETLEGVADVVKDKNLLICSDEIYERLTFDGETAPSPALIPSLRDKTIIINGFSKAFAMTGWRLGYACGPAPVIEQMVKLHQFAIMCAPTNSQFAAVEALKNCDMEVEMMVEAYDQRRRFLLNAFKEMGLECFEPYGAFYVFPSIKKFGMTSEEFATRLLSEQKLAVVPGTAFGASGEGFVRISYAYSIENLKVGLERIQKFIESLGGNDGRI